jgi:hypothetical protein
MTRRTEYFLIFGALLDLEKNSMKGEKKQSFKLK